MTVTSIVYYSITFIICLFVISRIIDIYSTFNGDREDIKHAFLYVCVSFILWSVSTVIVGISNSSVLDRVFLLIAEFMKLGTFVAFAELCASITDRVLNKRRSSYTVSSELLYFGVLVQLIRLLSQKADIEKTYFGDNFKMNNLSIIVNVFFYVVVIFFVGAYTYMHYYSRSTRRELYISKYCAVMVGILAVSLAAETVGYVLFDAFIPSMYVGMLACIFIFRNLVVYKRSIEYAESDYNHILEPSHQKPAFVCDDTGKVLFENTRAFVMKQTYKDNYMGRLLTEIFDITDYDKDRLKDPRNTQVFGVYCSYPKEQREILLNVKHNLDRFGAIFSTEVEVGYADAPDEDVVVAAGSENAEKSLTGINLSLNEVQELRTEGLIKQLELQKKLYENGNKKLYELNIKGISKAAGVLELSALEELCDRIQTELTYGEWEALESMMVDVDRQYEMLVMLNS